MSGVERERKAAQHDNKERTTSGIQTERRATQHDDKERTLSGDQREKKGRRTQRQGAGQCPEFRVQRERRKIREKERPQNTTTRKRTMSGVQRERKAAEHNEMERTDLFEVALELVENVQLVKGHSQVERTRAVLVRFLRFAGNKAHKQLLGALHLVGLGQILQQGR